MVKYAGNYRATITASQVVWQFTSLGELTTLHQNSFFFRFHLLQHKVLQKAQHFPGLIGTPISESYFLRYHICHSNISWYFYRKLWNHCFVSLRPFASGICLLSLVSTANDPKLSLILLLNFLEIHVMSSCFARMLTDLASNFSIQFVKVFIPWQRRKKANKPDTLFSFVSSLKQSHSILEHLSSPELWKHPVILTTGQ